MTIRTVLRTGVILTGVPLVAVLASPAAATKRDAGDEPGESLSTLGALGLFVGIPLGLFLLIWALVMLPSSIRGPRYRPHQAWRAEPLWFGGPPDPEQALAAAVPEGERGGAHGRW